MTTEPQAPRPKLAIIVNGDGYQHVTVHGPVNYDTDDGYLTVEISPDTAANICERLQSAVNLNNALSTPTETTVTGQ